MAVAAVFGLLVQRMDRYLPSRRLALWTAGLVAAVAALVALGPSVTRYSAGMWLFWAVLIVRFIRVDHPPVMYDEPLTPGRRVLGILCLVILVLCFSPRPFFGTM